MIRFEGRQAGVMAGIALLPLAIASGAHGQAGRLGQALAIDGQQILVGEPSSNFRPGVVYVYRNAAGGWTRGETISAPQPERADGFGDALTLNGGTLFAGQAERIHVFTKNNDAWRAIQAIEAPGTDERFATAMASAGDIDVSNPDAPVGVAHFDTAPYLEDAPGFSGTCSNYPFFPSGTVIVSVQEGLFILKKRDRPVREAGAGD